MGQRCFASGGMDLIFAPHNDELSLMPPRHTFSTSFCLLGAEQDLGGRPVYARRGCVTAVPMHMYSGDLLYVQPAHANPQSFASFSTRTASGHLGPGRTTHTELITKQNISCRNTVQQTAPHFTGQRRGACLHTFVGQFVWYRQISVDALGKFSLCIPHLD